MAILEGVPACLPAHQHLANHDCARLPFGLQYERAWFRRLFMLPSSMAGTQLKLRFGGVKYNAQVWLNGTFIGGYLNGYEPFELDITAAALAGQTNELIVGVTDWTASFSAPVDFSAKPADQNARDFVRTNILGADRRALRTLRSLAAGEGGERAGCIHRRRVRHALGAHAATDRPPARCATTPARPRAWVSPIACSMARTSPWRCPFSRSPCRRLRTRSSTSPPPGPGAHLWSHLDPYLYQLETTHRRRLWPGPGPHPVRLPRVWAENGRFYLNGTPINLLAVGDLAAQHAREHQPDRPDPPRREGRQQRRHPLPHPALG